MADSKLTALTALTTPAGADLLYIVDDVAGTATGKKITLSDLFGNVPVDTDVSGALSATTFDFANGGSYLTPVIRNAAETTTGFSYITTTNTGYIAGGVDVVAFGRSGAVPFLLMKSTCVLNWSNVNINGSGDVGIKRSASGQLQVTDGSTGAGELIFIVPTSDPGISGALWNNGGSLAISA